MRDRIENELAGRPAFKYGSPQIDSHTSMSPSADKSLQYNGRLLEKRKGDPTRRKAWRHPTCTGREESLVKCSGACANLLCIEKRPREYKDVRV